MSAVPPSRPSTGPRKPRKRRPRARPRPRPVIEPMRPAPPPPRPPRPPRPPGALARLLASPLPVDRIEDAAERFGRVFVRIGLAATVVALLIGLGVMGWHRWSQRPEVLVPRHRAEALCFALARPPAFAPLVRIESGAAMIRGRFNEHTPAGVAVREAMGLGEEMVFWERRTHVGDFDVVAMWLRLPARSGARHWLIVAWMEGSDLATTSFRFAGDDVSPSSEERLWGVRLLRRILVPENFRADALPAVTWRGSRDGAFPSFGPPPRRSSPR